MKDRSDSLERRLALNCDLGEGESLARTRALMRWIDYANVACGGHAGDVQSMRACVRLTRQFGVRLGAHPGPWSRGDRGRGASAISAEALELLLLQQVGALASLASAGGVRLHHIKLHGALYHAVEEDRALARAYLRTVRTHWPQAVVCGRAGGGVTREARRAGVRCLAEGFADRAYQPDGRLVPRSEPGAVLRPSSAVLLRVRQYLAGRGIAATNGQRLFLAFDTLCVHADSPDAGRLVREIARMLRR